MEKKKNKKEFSVIFILFIFYQGRSVVATHVVQKKKNIYIILFQLIRTLGGNDYFKTNRSHTVNNKNI